MAPRYRALGVAALAVVLGVAARGGSVYLVTMTKLMPPARMDVMVVNDSRDPAITAHQCSVTFETKHLPSGAAWTATAGPREYPGLGRISSSRC